MKVQLIYSLPRNQVEAGGQLYAKTDLHPGKHFPVPGESQSRSGREEEKRSLFPCWKSTASGPVLR